jgi:hypothetical protein
MLSGKHGREGVSMADKAIVRQQLEQMSGVSRSWFEWSRGGSSALVKTLVVEVDFDTDPNSSEFRQDLLGAIESRASDVLTGETTMVVSYLRIVPKEAR